MHAEKDNYDITFMCRLMNVARSTYYAWTNQAETPTQARRRALAVVVAEEFDHARQTSGCRRIAAAPGSGSRPDGSRRSRWSGPRPSAGT